MILTILGVLKIIGIVLCCILLFFLLVLLLILFWPIKYRLKASVNENEKKLTVKGHWLPGFVRFYYDLEEKKTSLKILFFELLKNKTGDKDSKNKTEKDGDKGENTEKNQDFGIDHNAGAEHQGSDNSDVRENIGANSKAEEAHLNELHKSEDSNQSVNSEINGNSSEQDKRDKTHKRDEDSAQEDAGNNESKYGDSSSQNNNDSEDDEEYTPNKNILNKIWYTITSLCDKIKKVYGNISFWKNFITDCDNQNAFLRIFKKILKVVRGILPRKTYVECKYGTGEPDVNAFIYGLYGMALTKLRGRFYVDCDMDEKVFRLKADIRGRIRLIGPALSLLSLLLDKDVRRMIKMVKNRND
ncbi:MAG: hypothetical protein K6F84_04235 [Lachnospiraceae bacterium]|nr:hypothetical protein [Lachnospiraceae bacterium]